MQPLVDKYADKLVKAGLADPATVVVGGLDADLVWNTTAPVCEELAKLFDDLNINSLMFARPAEPYRTIIEYLAGRAGNVIYPTDCETRTFMHDIPVVREFDAKSITAALKKRKSAVIPGRGVVTWGVLSPEQAFIFYSSLCFACFVKFFSDYLAQSVTGGVSSHQRRVFDAVVRTLPPYPQSPPGLARGPFNNQEEILAAIIEAGRATVDHGLVDSFFGNVSYYCDDTLYISQTTSSLDELEGCIDPCPLDGSSCAGITASSEFSAHRDVVLGTGNRAILHGHPKFAVILSMDCRETDCPCRGDCHTRCPKQRGIEDVPIVPGEVGTGPHGLCHTLPPAMAGRRGVIVYGHGLFTVGREDFNEAFESLLSIERRCRELYFERVKTAQNE